MTIFTWINGIKIKVDCLEKECINRTKVKVIKENFIKIWNINWKRHYFRIEVNEKENSAERIGILNKEIDKYFEDLFDQGKRQEGMSFYINGKAYEVLKCSYWLSKGINLLPKGDI